MKCFTVRRSIFGSKTWIAKNVLRIPKSLVSKIQLVHLSHAWQPTCWQFPCMQAQNWAQWNVHLLWLCPRYQAIFQPFLWSNGMSTSWFKTVLPFLHPPPLQIFYHNRCRPANQEDHVSFACQEKKLLAHLQIKLRNIYICLCLSFNLCCFPESLPQGNGSFRVGWETSPKGPHGWVGETLGCLEPL
jgi:hypothetical protein